MGYLNAHNGILYIVQFLDAKRDWFLKIIDLIMIAISIFVVFYCFSELTNLSHVLKTLNIGDNLKSWN